MAGHKRDGKLLHIIDIPRCLVYGQVTGLADNGELIDGKGLVLPVKEIACGRQDGLSFVGFRAKDGHVQIQSVPVVPLKFIRGEEYLIVVFTSVVRVPVLRFPSPVHLQFEVWRLHGKASSVIKFGIIRHTGRPTYGV